MRFELFIAARYLRAKRRQAVIGVITVISVLGVAAGVASLIIALAINNGFRQDLQERLLGSTSHVNLMRIENDGIKEWRPLLDRLVKTPHVIAGSPAIYEQVLISRGARAKGAVLKGILPERERGVSELLSYVNQGSALPLTEAQQRHEAGRAPAQEKGAPAGSPANRDTTAGDLSTASPSSLAGVRERFEALPPIILGKDMADELGARVNSVVLVTSPQGELTPFGIVPKYVRFKVAGIFQSGFYDYDSAWALTDLADSQRLFGLGDLVSVLEFKLDDIYKAGEVGEVLRQEAGKGFQSTNWMEQNRALFRALRLERMVTLITIGLIVFVAALNILISLIMMVMEKTKDIAVLVSMGATTRQVRRIFILQGMLIGIIGTAIGLALGYALSWAGGHYRLIALSAEVYSIDYVPFAPRVFDGVLVSLVALGVSFIATVYPSYSASRILPAEALRYE
ncbi:MAG: FtsX-like permease family protein [Candidatus Korobacteraceae bacterium]|jgi:lipoprotein-releasing system permease protein